MIYDIRSPTPEQIFIKGVSVVRGNPSSDLSDLLCEAVIILNTGTKVIYFNGMFNERYELMI